MRFRRETKFDGDKRPVIHLYEFAGGRKICTRLLTTAEAEEIRHGISEQQRFLHARSPRQFKEEFDGKAAAAGE